MTKLFWIVILIVVVFLGFSFLENTQEVTVEAPGEATPTELDLGAMMADTPKSEDSKMMEVDEAKMAEMMEMIYQYSGELVDVTDGEVRGINTGGESTGVTKANYKDGQYNLLATFKNLPDPVGTDFYEGWVVRRGINFDVISTGVVKKIEGVYTDTYASEMNLVDHDFYVLTLEPDDGDPAPADHILEGTLVR